MPDGTDRRGLSVASGLTHQRGKSSPGAAHDAVLSVSSRTHVHDGRSLHGLPVGLACFDSTLTNTYANRRFAELMGRSVPDVDGATLPELLRSAHCGELGAKIADIPPWRHARIEYSAPDPVAGGHQRRFAFEQVPALDGDGADHGQWILITDMTDVLPVWDHDEAVAKTVSKFFSNMNHELRTPLNAVLGFAQIGLLESEASPNVRECFTRISAAGQQLLTLVSDLIDLSMLEAGALVLRDAVVMPSQIVEQGIARFAAAAAAKGVELIGESSPGPLPTMRGDADKLSQVLNVLIGNAVHFTDHGRIKVRAEHADDALVVRVSDTGSGIDPAQLQRIFFPGSQLEASYLTQRGGAGLGLAVADGLVKLMGGEIKVASELGLGSVFEVRVPWRSADR